MRIAVVGAGIAGLGAAWALARRHEVTLYESAGYLGGHANTVELPAEPGPVPVDTGFIVYNDHNYPNLTRLFDAIDAPTVASEMSFSVSIGRGAFEYSGSALGIVAQPANLLRRDFWRMLRDLVRFYRAATALAGGRVPSLTLGELLEQGGYSRAFAELHLLPMAGAIWSSPLETVLDFPAETFVRFFDNHGLLSLGTRPQWRSVLGGSREYVRRLVAQLPGRIETGVGVEAVRRTPDGVMLRDTRGTVRQFDQAVFATHADDTLAILGAAASPDERRVLGAFAYEPNHAVLHGDETVMPKRRATWSSWNYTAERAGAAGGGVAVTYWMNRLQRLATSRNVFVTLNPDRQPEQVHGEFSYRHPRFDLGALAAQRELPALQGLDRLWFCGAYCGYGFHEDGLQAGLGVAAALGAPAPWAGDIVPMSPAIDAVTPRRYAAAAE